MDINDKVALSRCEEYDAETILEKLREMSDVIGFDKKSVMGKKVVLKPNLLLAYTPERAATTHPAVMEAAARLMKEWGASEVLIAESPGGIYNERSLDRTYTVTGMKDAAEKSGAELNYDFGWSEFPTPDGVVSKTVNVISPIMTADVIVNLCKMKTHALATMTGAAKNLFGVIPGITKFEMHARFKNPSDFFSMIIDLDCELAKQRRLLNICDGIVGMEGDGPSGGTPKKAGVLLMSENPFNLDTVSAEIMGLSGRVKLLELASERGLCPGNTDAVQVTGLSPKDVGCGAFALPDAAKGAKFALIPPFLQPRPAVDGKLCKGCGTCVKSCPQHTIKLKDGKARIDRTNCIRCYCCQELCTFKAIKIKKSFIYKIVK